eukprot:SAG11_NODE_371_length_10051_cov_5.987741_2_plen_229_part_00
MVYATAPGRSHVLHPFRRKCRTRKLGLTLACARGQGIAARLNPDFADMDSATGVSRVSARFGPLRLVAQPPRLGPAASPLIVLVPFRDRMAHLRKLLPALAAALGRPPTRVLGGKIGDAVEGGDVSAGQWRLVVVEQANQKRWNKGLVYNAGFDWLHRHSRRGDSRSVGSAASGVESELAQNGHALGGGGAECFCFHDVDFLPRRSADGGPPARARARPPVCSSTRAR